MLSRFRMTVDECIREYEILGEMVFRYPRELSLKGLNHPKFYPESFVKALKDVTRRRPAEYDHLYAMDKMNQDMSKWYAKVLLLVYKV